ncbi:MAG: zinc ribbon domain-containing protein [Clostridiales bacterium]|nr:zinc ribbon domain-containing protein [Clostridiales bacterium]
MFCGNCGRENDASSKFCVACGQSLAKPDFDTQILNNTDDKAVSYDGAPSYEADSTQIPANAQQPVQPATPQYQYNAPAVGVQEMPKKKKSGKKIALAIVAVILVLIIGGGAAITVAVLNNPKVEIALAAKKFIENDNGELVFKLKVNGLNSTIRLKYEFNPSQKKCNLIVSLPDDILDGNDFALCDGILFITGGYFPEEFIEEFGVEALDVKEFMDYFWSIYDSIAAALKSGDKNTFSKLYNLLLEKAEKIVAEYDPDGELGLSDEFEYFKEGMENYWSYIDMAKVDEAINTLVNDAKTEDFWENYMGYEYTKEGDSKVYKIAPDIERIVDYGYGLMKPAVKGEPEAIEVLLDEFDADVEYFKDNINDSDIKVEASVYITKGILDKIEGVLKSDGEKMGSAVLSFTNQGEINIKNELGKAYEEAAKKSVTLKEYMNEDVTQNVNQNACAAGIREIESMLSQYAMGVTTGSPIKLTAGSATITTNANGDGAVYDCGTITNLSTDVFCSLFRELPYCPIPGNVITITVFELDAITPYQKIIAYCNGTNTGMNHSHN